MKTRLMLIALSAVAAAATLLWLNRTEAVPGIHFSTTEFRATPLPNPNPYAIFDSEPVMLTTSHERDLDHTIEIPNSDNTSPVDRLVLNTQTGIATLFDKTGRLIAESLLEQEELARFISQDRYARKYASMSPYGYCANNPVNFTDPTGDTIRIEYYGRTYLYEDGELFLDGELFTGKLRGDLKTTVEGLNKIRGTETGGEMLGDLQSSVYDFLIKSDESTSRFDPGTEKLSHEWRNYAEYTRVQETGEKVIHGDKYPAGQKGSGGIVYWSGVGVDNVIMGPNGRTGTLSPVLSLAHELGHAWDAARGILDTRPVEFNGGFEQAAEIRADYVMNMVASQLNKNTFRYQHSEDGAVLWDGKGQPMNFIIK